MIDLGAIRIDTIQFNGKDVTIYCGDKIAYQPIKFTSFGKYNATHSHTDAACYSTTTCGLRVESSVYPYTYTCHICGTTNTVPMTNWGCIVGHYDCSAWSTGCSKCGESHVVSTGPEHTYCVHDVRGCTCSISSLGYVSLIGQGSSLTTDNHLSGATLTSWSWSCKLKKDGSTVNYGTGSVITPKHRGTYTCVIGWRDNKTGANNTGTITATTN